MSRKEFIEIALLLDINEAVWALKARQRRSKPRWME